ncbi:hypothetical protein [Acrocarpospora catenulata]|uniref:hypothetical protein n=1 Tax=Acrocarpospora catenulata TaxID=2836182 RepID=UPI001BDA9A68|nr:hypothetical protein [Acrocarpospora catenulata]
MSGPDEGEPSLLPRAENGVELDGQITTAQDGARHWIRQDSAVSVRGVAWASLRAMLAGQCASALVPIALAEPGLLPVAAGLAAGLEVVGSVGSNILASLIGESLNAARARTRRPSPADPGPANPDAGRGPDAGAGPDAEAGEADAAFAEQARQELAARIEQVLAAQDRQAEALAATLARVLERIDATAVVVGEVMSRGQENQERLLRDLTAGFAGLGGQVAGFGPLLRGLDGAVVRIQQTLSRQDAERRFRPVPGPAADRVAAGGPRAAGRAGPAPARGGSGGHGGSHGGSRLGGSGEAIDSLGGDLPVSRAGPVRARPGEGVLWPRSVH